MDRSEYVRRVLEAYRTAPGTGGTVRGPDRLFAAQRYERGAGLEAVENALILPAARRAGAPPLGAIRSLASPRPCRFASPSRVHANGVDDDACLPVLNPVLRAGQFWRTLVG